MNRSPIRLAEDTWIAAINSPYGVGVIVTDLIRARSQLYRARDRLGDKGINLSNYLIRTSPENPAFELWIIRIPNPPANDAPPPSPAA